MGSGIEAVQTNYTRIETDPSRLCCAILSVCSSCCVTWTVSRVAGTVLAAQIAPVCSAGRAGTGNSQCNCELPRFRQNRLLNAAQEEGSQGSGSQEGDL